MPGVRIDPYSVVRQDLIAVFVVKTGLAEFAGTGAAQSREDSLMKRLDYLVFAIILVTSALPTQAQVEAQREWDPSIGISWSPPVVPITVGFSSDNGFFVNIGGEIRTPVGTFEFWMGSRDGQKYLIIEHGEDRSYFELGGEEYTFDLPAGAVLRTERDGNVVVKIRERDIGTSNSGHCCDRDSTHVRENSCRYANDGECDEPTYCKRGTDTNDCRGLRPRRHQNRGYRRGHTMQSCGCWSGSPVQSASEPRCASGYVELGWCAGVCPNGYSPFGYTCS